MKKIFEHPIISAVVAGLILYIATQVDGFWSSVWKFLSSVLLKTLNILQTEVSIPLWVVLLASILLILGLIKFLLFVTKKLKNRDLNSEEISLLELIVIKDGQALDYNEITSKLKVKKLIAEQIDNSSKEKKARTQSLTHPFPLARMNNLQLFNVAAKWVSEGM